MAYLHLVRTFCRFSYSSFKCCVVELTGLALWSSVLITRYSAEVAWWLSQWQNWSVWVGFLTTVVMRLPSGWGMASVSRKNIESSALVFSAVNCMPSFMELMWSRNSFLFADVMTTNVSSTYLFHRLGGVVMCWGLSLQSLPCIGWLQWGLWMTSWLHPPMFILVDTATIGKTSFPQWPPTRVKMNNLSVYEKHLKASSGKPQVSEATWSRP